MSLACRISVVSIAFALAASACGPKAPEVRPGDDLYAEGSEAHLNQAYERAIEHYREFLDNYPLDDRAETVELKKAQAHYANEDYSESIAAFSDFQRMHPTSPHLAGVEYSIGQAFMDQMTTIDRDLGAASNAARRFESVVARYPGDPHAVEAARKLQIVREDLAGRELYIAQFYYRHDRPNAARVRLTGLIARYPETIAAGEGIARLAEDAQASGDTELAALCDEAAREHDALRAARPNLPEPNLTTSAWRDWFSFSWMPRFGGKPHDPIAAGDIPPPAATSGAPVPQRADLVPPAGGPATAALVRGMKARDAVAVASAPSGGGTTSYDLGRAPGTLRGAGVPVGTGLGSPGLGGGFGTGGLGGGPLPGR